MSGIGERPAAAHVDNERQQCPNVGRYLPAGTAYLNGSASSMDTFGCGWRTRLPGGTDLVSQTLPPMMWAGDFGRPCLSRILPARRLPKRHAPGASGGNLVADALGNDLALEPGNDSFRFRASSAAAPNHARPDHPLDPTTAPREMYPPGSLLRGNQQTFALRQGRLPLRRGERVVVPPVNRHGVADSAPVPAAMATGL